MIAQTQAELLKIRSTRTTIGIVLGMIALILLFSLLSGLLTKAPHLTSTEDQRGLLSVGSLAGVFSALAGIMLVTSEYRFGTIRPTFLFTPQPLTGGRRQARRRPARRDPVRRRRRGIGFAIGYATLTGRGISYALNGSQTALLVLGTLAGVALWGALGVGLGADRPQPGRRDHRPARLGLRRRKPPLRLRPIGRPLRPRPRPKRPHGTHQRKHLLPAAAGGATLLAWTIAFALAGTALAARRDVT